MTKPGLCLFVYTPPKHKKCQKAHVEDGKQHTNIGSRSSFPIPITMDTAELRNLPREWKRSEPSQGIGWCEALLVLGR